MIIPLCRGLFAITPVSRIIRVIKTASNDRSDVLISSIGIQVTKNIRSIKSGSNAAQLGVYFVTYPRCTGTRQIHHCYLVARGS